MITLDSTAEKASARKGGGRGWHVPSFERSRTERIIDLVPIQRQLTSIQPRLRPTLPLRLLNIPSVTHFSQVPLVPVAIAPAVLFARLRRWRGVSLTTLSSFVPVVAVSFRSFAVDGDAFVDTFVPLPVYPKSKVRRGWTKRRVTTYCSDKFYQWDIFRAYQVCQADMSRIVCATC